MVAEVFFAWQRLEGRSGHEICRQLLENLYHTHVGQSMPDILVQPMGKPCFVGGEWHFSLAHSRNHGFCVLATCPVGVDAEELSRRVKPLLAEKILSDQERRRYAESPDPNRALLTFWVLKEAAGKLSGRGIGFHPNHTNFTLDDRRVQEIDGALVAIMTQEDQENAF